MLTSEIIYQKQYRNQESTWLFRFQDDISLFPVVKGNLQPTLVLLFNLSNIIFISNLHINSKIYENEATVHAALLVLKPVA